ncbi:LysR family transcriptional regulator [Neorhizobium sp. JUb45]|uniref:LysR family transcriptional regulator n=1 Tax=Neorhizobium sp. JUb45 TaxID=2485113 RepID=UPI00104C4339|nr:LysR family transcriptional regulator [Neorhizobium sp. JUb45]TCQ99395.1 DNA-binding transcriptional LysR family regulator [Neorhizobium sp. JUb45]
MIAIEDMAIFAKVVATHSMSLTARSLGITPAVVSKRIQRLEEQLGARLLQRTTRKITITEAGQGFYDRVINILASVEEAQSFASGRSSRIVGTLRVAAPTSFGRMHIAPHLPGLMAAYPQLTIELMLSDSVTDIVGDGYDLAIRIGELKDSRLVARKICAVTRVLCAAPAYLDRAGAPTKISDLQDHQCLPAHNGEPWRLEGPDGPLTYRPEGMLRTNSSEVIRETVIAGLGIALRSTWDVGKELSKGELVRVLPAYQGSRNATISAVFPTRAHLPAKVRIFIDYLQDIYGPDPCWEV